MLDEDIAKKYGRLLGSSNLFDVKNFKNLIVEILILFSLIL